MTSTTARRVLATALGALALATAAAPAQARGGYYYHGGYHGGYYGGYHHHGGYYYRGGWPVWAGVGLALDVGLASAYYYDRPYVIVDQPPVVYAPPAPVVVYPNAAPAPAPAAPAQPDPIFYPRNGQSPQQTEADRRACNAWATTQPNAMADASVFQRATLACMDGRGYTAR
jgi:hypothetical protein